MYNDKRNQPQDRHSQEHDSRGQEIKMKDQGRGDRREPGHQETQREPRKQDQRTHRDEPGRDNKRNPR